MTDVFISYSRKDKAFVQVLHQALEKSSYDSWVDWEDIPLTADWWEEIESGIEAADTFIFVLSPDSVASKICRQEIDHATAYEKRLVPIVRRDGFDMELVHPTLGKTNWLFFQKNNDFDTAFHALIETLNTDLDHVKDHTKLLVKAVEWDHKNKTDDILLRGSELTYATDWLQQALVNKKYPVPAPVQISFIQASQTLRDRLLQAEQDEQKRTIRRVRLVALGSIITGFAMAGLAIFALVQKHQVETVQESQVNALSRYSLSLTAADKSFDALIEALRAGQQLRKQLNRFEDKTHSQVLTALQAAVYADGWREHNRLSGHTNDVNRLAISPDGQTMASASRDHTIWLWTLEGAARQRLEGHNDSVTGVAFSPDGLTLASSSADRTVKLWTPDGTLLQTFAFDSETKDVSFSPDGQRLAIATNQQVLLVTLDGDTIRRFPHDNWVNSVQFSADGNTLLTGTYQATQLWAIDGQLLQTLPNPDWVNMARFSPSQPGSPPMIAAAGKNAIQLWTMDGTLLRTLPHTGWVNSVRFSPNGQRIIATDSTNQVTLWTLEHETEPPSPQRFPQDRDTVDAIFSADGRVVAIANRDNIIHLWRRSEDVISPSLYKGTVQQLRFNADGSRVAIMAGSTLQLWTDQGQMIQSWTFEQPLGDISIGPGKSEELLAIARGSTVYLQTLDGRNQQTWDYPTPVNSVDISPDGTMLVATGGTEVYLSTSEGEPIQTLSDLALPQADSAPADMPAVWEARFSPDGQHIAIRSQGSVLKIWHLTGERANSITPLTHDDTIHSFSFSPGSSKDNALLATGGDDSTLRLWNLAGKQQEILFNETTFNNIRFSANGEVLAAVDADNRINLWQVGQTQLTPVISLVRHKNSINSLEFSPDHQSLVSAGADEQVIVWNLDSLTLAGLMNSACQVVDDYLTTNRQLDDGDRNLCQGTDYEHNE
ncbi:MAG: TIR domain-containing protein [Cyanobacteria bacterium P01_D01_bin.2]